jgi:hypothetical protein
VVGMLPHSPDEALINISVKTIKLYDMYAFCNCAGNSLPFFNVNYAGTQTPFHRVRSSPTHKHVNGSYFAWSSSLALAGPENIGVIGRIVEHLQAIPACQIIHPKDSLKTNIDFSRMLYLMSFLFGYNILEKSKK